MPFGPAGSRYTTQRPELRTSTACYSSRTHSGIGRSEELANRQVRDVARGVIEPLESDPAAFLAPTAGFPS
jgi:hypothetical protein